MEVFFTVVAGFSEQGKVMTSDAVTSTHNIINLINPCMIFQCISCENVHFLKGNGDMTYRQCISSLAAQILAASDHVFNYFVP